MRKNGFTLIELLAVIVILAIIALIATPIILGIINDAREKANERSVELYAAAVKNGIAAYQLTGLNAPKSFSDLDIQYDGDVKCTTQELYEDGSFYLEGCKVNNGTKEYSYGTKQGSSIEVGTMSICNPISVQTAGTYTAGDKYECDVDPTKEGYDYTFYVLNVTSESVNLIMDRNICEDGTEATESNTCTYAWYADAADNSYGPVTAMAKLNAATSSWDNVLALDTTYSDEGKHFTNFALTGKARLPKLSEVSDYDGNNAYLYDNFEKHYYCYDNEEDYNEVSCGEAGYIEGVYDDSITHIDNIWGYWTLSSRASYPDSALFVACEGDANGSTNVNNNDDTGIRPVIKLSI